MKDPRHAKLAEVLVGHSARVVKGDKVLIEAFDIPADFIVELIRVIAEAGGLPLVSTYQQPVLRALYQAASALALTARTTTDPDVLRERLRAVAIAGSRAAFSALSSLRLMTPPASTTVDR